MKAGREPCMGKRHRCVTEGGEERGAVTMYGGEWQDWRLESEVGY